MPDLSPSLYRFHLPLKIYLTPTEPRQYTATALATGGGRNGTTKVTGDAHSPLDTPITLAMPKSLGGTGVGSNPEQLFAAGYAGCFLGAIQAVALNAGKDAKDATVNVKTHIGASDGMPGFALSVEIEVSGVKDEEIVKKAHEVSDGFPQCEEVMELMGWL
jgi:Ohr subfamily peroxiredoxin